LVEFGLDSDSCTPIKEYHELIPCEYFNTPFSGWVTMNLKLKQHY